MGILKIVGFGRPEGQVYSGNHPKIFETLWFNLFQSS